MMTRLLLIVAAALLATACGTQVPLQAAPKRVGMEATATLATNACEAAIAADYTGITVAARNAERRVNAGRLDTDRARRVLDLGRGARADLDAACPRGQPDAIRIERARAALTAMRELLRS